MNTFELTEIKNSDILTLEDLQDQILYGDWDKDDELARKLITDMTCYFISLDTTTETGDSDFSRIFAGIGNIARNIGLHVESFIPSTSTKNRPIMLIGTDSEKINRFVSANRFRHDSSVNLLCSDLIHAHVDTHRHSGDLGRNKPYVDPITGLIYGRGTNDMKAQAAVALLHCAQLVRNGYNTDKNSFLFLLTSDEELAGAWSGDYVENIYALRALELEPTGNISGGYSSEISSGYRLKFPVQGLTEAERILFKSKLNSSVHSILGNKSDNALIYDEEDQIVLSLDNNSNITYSTLIRLRDYLSENSFRMDPKDYKFDSSTSKLSDEYERILSSSFTNNYPLVEHSREGKRISLAEVIDKEKRQLRITHNFATELTMYLKSKHRNLVVASVAELGDGRHTDKEAVSSYELVYLLRTLNSIYSDRYN